MSVHKQEVRRITTHQLQEMKNRGEKIAMLTAYDYSMARIIDGAGVDVILVGDSASNVMAGHETTLPITLDQMIYHAASVVRAVKRALVVVDLPFGTYQGSSGEALRSSIRIMKEAGAHAVKLEGGSEIKESVDRILSAGIPVMGHLGLTPQSIYKFGTYTVRAREEAEAKKLLDDAVMLSDCGCFCHCAGKDPRRAGQESVEGSACSDDRNWGRARCRRTSAGDAGYARDYQRIQAKISAPLCGPRYRGNESGEALRRRCEGERFSQRRGKILTTDSLLRDRQVHRTKRLNTPYRFLFPPLSIPLYSRCPH